MGGPPRIRRPLVRSRSEPTACSPGWWAQPIARAERSGGRASVDSLPARSVAQRANGVPASLVAHPVDRTERSGGRASEDSLPARSVAQRANGVAASLVAHPVDRTERSGGRASEDSPPARSVAQRANGVPASLVSPSDCASGGKRWVGPRGFAARSFGRAASERRARQPGEPIRLRERREAVGGPQRIRRPLVRSRSERTAWPPAWWPIRLTERSEGGRASEDSPPARSVAQRANGVPASLVGPTN